MKYYKLINQEGWPKKDWKAGKIYPETYKIDGSWVSTVRDFVSAFVNDWQEVSEEEYNIQEGIVKEFKLPEKWCIQLNNDNRNAVGVWFDDNVSESTEYTGTYADTIWRNSFLTYPKHGDYTCTASIVLEGYTEITFDQFKQYVLKEITMNTPKRISFYVKYTPEFTKDLYNKLMEWSKNNTTGRVRKFDDTYSGLQEHKFFLFDNWGLNNKAYPREVNLSYGVDNNYQGCKKEYSVSQVKKLINYNESTMKNQALTFKITGSKALLKAMWSDLLEAGYIEVSKNYSPSRTDKSEYFISTNAHTLSTQTNFKELFCGDVSCDFHKTFNLPEQYNEALEFAKEQLKCFNKVEEFKEGDYIYILNSGGAIGAPQVDGNKVYKISKLDPKNSYKDINVDLDFWYRFRLFNGSSSEYFARKATPEEIKKYEKDALLEEAKKRYPVGTTVKSAYSGIRITVAKHAELFIDGDGSVDNGRNGYLYYNGKWAEIVKDSVNIKGYTPEYTASSVKFGCQTFSKQTALDLPRLIDLGIIKSDYEKELREVAKHFSK